MSNTTTPALSVDAALAAESVALLHLSFEGMRSHVVALSVVQADADTALYDMVGVQPRWDVSRVDYVWNARMAASGRYVPQIVWED